MNRSPFIPASPSRARERVRRRRRRRALILGVLGLTAAIALVLLVRDAGDRPGGTGTDLAGVSRAVQLANGPVVDPPGRRPLSVRLDVVGDPVRIRFRHPPASGLLFDLDTGEVLWRLRPERVLPIASLTKMMTALVVVRHAPPDAKVPVTEQALHFQGSGLGVLPRHGRIRLETMLNGLLLPSGNDAAIALSQRISGTQAAFVAAMNAEASAMGLACTHFTSPSGFYDAGNHSCAADLAALARADLDEPRLARIVRRRRAFLPFPIKGGRIYLYNNNPLIRLGFPGITGLKTGYTRRAGSCLVATATRHGRRLGVVLLHSPETGTQAAQLLDAGFRVRAGHL